MKRPTRKPYKYKGKTITPLPTGRLQIRVKDATGKYHRPSFATDAEAKAAVQQFLERQARGERFLATAAHTTFGEACDLRIQDLRHRGCAASTIQNAEQTQSKHFADFAPRRLSWFIDDRMQTVKQWIAEKKNEGYSHGLLTTLRKEMKRAFDAAIHEGKLAPPNPMSAYGVSIPYVETERRQPLSIEDMTALVRGASRRRDREPELVFHARFVMTLLGLSVPLRDQDLCGLCWDCVDLDGRRIYLHRKVARIEAPRGLPRGQATKRWALVEGTKTGEAGKGECHLSPVAHAVLTEWRDLLRERGFPTSGRIPMLRTSESEMLTTDTVNESHVPTLMLKARLVNESDQNKYNWYHLRHTVPSMWRAIGMDLDEIKDRMRHMRLETTERYRHRVPEYVKVLRPQVEEVMEELGLQKDPDGLIEALSLVLVRMWRLAGIDIPCSPPTTMRQKRLPNYAAAEPAALNGTVIELTPDAVSTVEPLPPPAQQMLLSRQQMSELRRAEARKLRGPPYNWTKVRIATYLGIAVLTVNKYTGDEPDEPLNMRKLRAAKRKELHEELIAMLDAGRNSKQIADALNLSRQAVCTFARGRGTPVKPYRGPRKLGQYDAQIRAWNAEGISNYRIGKMLGFGSTTIDQYLRKRGLTAAGSHGRPKSGDVEGPATR
jgi:integrase